MKPLRRILALFAGACLAGSASGADEGPLLEVFQGPKPKKLNPVSYPQSEERVGAEGWVELNFMVDPTGKPYEVSVMESTGNPVFDQAAVRVVERSSFEPARIGARTIDSSMSLKVIFSMYTPATGARGEFVSVYRELNKALQAGDRPRADEYFAKLSVRNLYEDVYRHLALSNYAKRWGTEAEQRAALKRAVAGEKRPLYLESKVFYSVLEQLLALQLKAQDYGGALTTWRRLRDGGAKERIERWRETMTTVQSLRSAPGEVRLSGSLVNGSWFVDLFKSRFSVEVANGQVTDLKLRCEKQYLLFRYEPGVQYQIDAKNQECTLELVGQPGTTVTLSQT
jgi:TonB family protein